MPTTPKFKLINSVTNITCIIASAAPLSPILRRLIPVVEGEERDCRTRSPTVVSSPHTASTSKTRTHAAKAPSNNAALLQIRTQPVNNTRGLLRRCPATAATTTPCQMDRIDRRRTCLSGGRNPPVPLWSIRTSGKPTRLPENRPTARCHAETNTPFRVLHKCDLDVCHFLKEYCFCSLWIVI